MTGRVVWDGRWDGTHGIGRHAREVRARLGHGVTEMTAAAGAPTSPLDPFVLRARLRLGRGDLFVTPGFNAALGGGRYRQLLTVHDLIHVRDQAESSRAKRWYYARVVLPAVRATGRVLTVSEFSRREIVEWSGLPPQDVVVVGNGCSMRPATAGELAADPAQADPYVLFVGNPKPHKNLSLLVRAARHLPDDLRVVVVGVRQEDLAAQCAAHGVDPRRFTSRMHLSEPELRQAYLGARCVALPSTYEGFGLVPLEAMALGVPTAYLCDAVDEVVGELGFRSAHDAEAYAASILAASGARAELSGRLVARSQEFRWDDVAGRVRSTIATLVA